jgi:hypothetical protein
MRLEWHWEGDSGERFYRVVAGMSDTTPVMQDIAQWLFVDATDRFKRESAPDGSIWAPRAQSTLDAYRRQKSP